MKRGFIFSLDAALALIVVMALGTMLVFYFQAVEPRTEAYTASDRIAHDAATIGFYFDKDANEMGLTTFIPIDAEFGSCSIIYDYKIDETNLGNDPEDDLIENRYCEGM